MGLFNWGKPKTETKPQSSVEKKVDNKINTVDEESEDTLSILKNLDEGTYDDSIKKPEKTTVTDIKKDVEETKYNPEKYPKGIDIGENIIHRDEEDIAA